MVYRYILTFETTDRRPGAVDETMEDNRDQDVPYAPSDEDSRVVSTRPHARPRPTQVLNKHNTRGQVIDPETPDSSSSAPPNNGKRRREDVPEQESDNTRDPPVLRTSARANRGTHSGRGR